MFNSSTNNYQHAAWLLVELDKIRKEEEFCDGLVDVDGTEIPVQRNVLSAASPYFRALYKYNTRSDVSSNNDLNKKAGAAAVSKVNLDFPGVTASAFKSVLDYIYTAKVELTWTNIEEILCVSDVLLMFNLKDCCCEYLDEQISLSTCLAISHLAEIYSCAGLCTRACNYIDKHFQTLSTGSEFLELTYERLVSLLKRDSLLIKNEKVVLDACQHWIQHNPKDRLEYLESLLSQLIYVRQIEDQHLQVFGDNLKKLATDHATKLNTQYVEQCLQTVQGLKLSNPEDRSMMCPRGYKDLVVLCGGQVMDQNYDVKPSAAVFCAVLPENSIEAHYTTWIRLADMNAPRLRHGLVEAGGYLYAVGGQSPKHHPCKTAERYDPTTNTWTYISSMVEERDYIGLHASPAGDKLYAIGCGSQLDQCESYSEQYDIASDTWSLLPDIGSRRSCAASAIDAQGCIYVMGGLADYKLYESADMYSTRVGSWTSVTPMGERRTDARAIVQDGLLYVFGGVRKHGCPSMANVAGQKFCSTEVCVLPHANRRNYMAHIMPYCKPGSWLDLTRHGSMQGMCTMTDSTHINGLVEWNDQILVVGELDIGNMYNCIRAYAPLTNTWRGVVHNQPPLIKSYQVSMLKLSNNTLDKLVQTASN